MAQPLTSTVNMNRAELKEWLNNPRHLLASTQTGHDSLRRLAMGEHYHNQMFAETVDNFNTRHGLQGNLFGHEVGKSGWSKRAIALKNWGHDPSKASSPLHSADQDWLARNPAAASHRKGRVKNPMVISSMTVPQNHASRIDELTPFIHGDGENAEAEIAEHQGKRLYVYYPKDALLDDAYSIVTYGPYIITLSVLCHCEDFSEQSKRLSEEAVGGIEDSFSLDSDNYLAYQHLRPALKHMISRRYDKMPRKPNPALSSWLLPVAQFIVSAAGLFYSSQSLYDVYLSRKPSNYDFDEQLLQQQGTDYYGE